ncbi:hypothetical protein ACFL0H_13530 [Thermodesulfobacteriota bacterium]
MRNKTELNFLIITLLAISTLFSCIPETKREIVISKPKVIIRPVLPVDILDKKIYIIEKLLEKKEINGEDREIAVSLLSDYRKIRSVTRDSMSNDDYREIIDILFLNLNRLDQRYLIDKAGLDHQNYSKAINIFSFNRRKILDSYMSGDYLGVINGCIELETEFGPDSLTPEIGLLFAVSLAKKDMMKEAISIGERIVRELEGKPGLIHLKANIIEWQLDMGNRKKALQIFEKMIDNIDEREAIFNKTKQRMNQGEAKIPRRSEVVSDYYSREETPSPEPGRIEDLLNQVAKLVKEETFTDAKLLLIKWRLKTEEGDEIETIDQALKSVELAEEKYKEGLSNEKKSIESAMKLIEEENFVDAITRLEVLENDQENGPEAKRLKNLAIEELINHERNRAAKIFLMAKKAGDLEKKEELLLSSYNILENLIEKYPSSTLINKLNSNLLKVRNELEKLKDQSE